MIMWMLDIDLKTETHKWKERLSVFTIHKIINTGSGSENPNIFSSILEFHAQSTERLSGDRTELLSILGPSAKSEGVHPGQKVCTHRSKK